MGIEPSLLLPKLGTPQVVVGAQKLRAQLAAAEFVVASVDTLVRHAKARTPGEHAGSQAGLLLTRAGPRPGQEGLCGVPLKLLSFEAFLREHPHRARKTVFALHGIVPDARPDDYHLIRREVLALEGRINASVPGAVVFEEHSELGFEQRLVLWRVTGRPPLPTSTHLPPPPTYQPAAPNP